LREIPQGRDLEIQFLNKEMESVCLKQERSYYIWELLREIPQGIDLEIQFLNKEMDGV
jgi:hypothetical protein